MGYAPVEAATKNGIAVQKYRDEYSLKVAVDYSPHSHLWQVMKPVKENNPTESSTTEIDGEKVCNFITAWGDGLFPVYRDFDGSGELVQIRDRNGTHSIAQVDVRPLRSKPGREHF